MFEMKLWALDAAVKTMRAEPGRPWQNERTIDHCGRNLSTPSALFTLQIFERSLQPTIDSGRNARWRQPPGGRGTRSLVAFSGLLPVAIRPNLHQFDSEAYR